MKNPALQHVTVILREQFVVPATVRLVAVRETRGGETTCLEIGGHHYRAVIHWIHRDTDGAGKLSWTGDCETNEAVEAVTSLVHDLTQRYQIRPATAQEVKFFGAPRPEGKTGCIVKVH